MKSLNEMQQAVRAAIARIRQAANEAIAAMHTQTEKVSPQKRDRILKAAMWGGLAAIVVAGTYYWRTRNTPSISKELQ